MNSQPIFVKIAQGFGMNGICHTDYDSTAVKLHSFGIDIIPADHE
jgi:hypothetical protein